MELNVYYIGKDKLYWEKIKRVFTRDYPEFKFSFDQSSIDDCVNPRSCFKKIYHGHYHIVYLDFSTHSDEMLYLAKLLNRNNEMRLISVVGLFELINRDYIDRSISAEVRINHIKSSEMHDVIYDPLSLLNVNFAHKPAFVRSKELETLTINQPLRIGYIEDNYFHVETNSYLKVGDIINIDHHPLELIMPSHKVYVSKFYEKDLYYNKRFAYDLEFIYIDNDFFTSTNENWLLYKKYKNNPVTMEEELGEDVKEEVIRDMTYRKKKFKPIKAEIDQWLKEREGAVVPKKLKIMVVDEELNIFSELDANTSEFPYTLNVQTFLVGDYYQVKRSMPHLLVYHVTEERNTIENFFKMFHSLVKQGVEMPYFFLTNTSTSSNELRSQLSFEKILATKDELKLSDIRKLAETLDEKKHITYAHSKVFISSTDPASKMWMKRDVKVLGMTESILYFSSEVEVPMWTVFRVKEPVDMLLTVVPHKDDGDFKSEKNCYRCLINGTGELEKAKIRQMVNLSFKEEDEEN